MIYDPSCRKIEIYDTTSAHFKLFLEYVYKGSLDLTKMSLDQVSELLLLADRYEMDALKTETQRDLSDRVDADTALTLLGVSDTFYANDLKVRLLTSCVQALKMTVLFRTNVSSTSQSIRSWPRPRCSTASARASRSNWPTYSRGMPERPKLRSETPPKRSTRSRT